MTTNDEILKWEIINPNTDTKIIYTETNKVVLIADMVREEEKKLRINRLVSSKKKCAFNQETFMLLQSDRENGISIRALAIKYNKSTRTIQKYLKMEKLL